MPSALIPSPERFIKPISSLIRMLSLISGSHHLCLMTVDRVCWSSVFFIQKLRSWKPHSGYGNLDFTSFQVQRNTKPRLRCTPSSSVMVHTWEQGISVSASEAVLFGLE